MFDFLKKKINDFVGTITRKEEKKVEEQGEIGATDKQIGGSVNKVNATRVGDTSPGGVVGTSTLDEEKKADEQKPFDTAQITPENAKTNPQTGLLDIQTQSAQKIESDLAQTELAQKLGEEKPLNIEPSIPTMAEEAAREIIEEIETERKIEPEIFEKEKIAIIEQRKPKIIEIRKIEKTAVEIQKPKDEKIEAIIRESLKQEPESPGRIAIERKEFETAEIIEDIKQEEKNGIEEESEIEELVGETEEGRIRREAFIAERKIVEEKRREEFSRKVFTEKKEEFLAKGAERDLKPKVGIFSKIKGFFTGEVEIGEKETTELFEQFEMALLESDVSYPTAQALISDLKIRLIGRKVKTGKIQEEVKKEIAFALATILQASKSNFFEKVDAAKQNNKMPFIVLFLGPNGMGKTTTIAKVAYRLKKQGYSSVISASDTFRAAAIEQSLHHGEKLGIKVVKHGYGADPAAVAYDAINHAKSHKVDVVLIDTAGRQETNLNLLSEMQKIIRIVKPDLKIFIAEAIAGTTLVSQVKTFNEKMGLDGIILTKLDCDAKGGGSLSIAYECKLPVYFVGVGQEYEDLLEFNEEWIVKNIMAE